MQSLLDVSAPSSGIHDPPKQSHHIGKPNQDRTQKYTSTAATTDKQDPDIIEGKILSPSTSVVNKDTCAHTDQDSPAVIAVSTVIRSVLCSSPLSLKELIIRIRPFSDQFQAENGYAPSAAELLTYIEETAPEAIKEKHTSSRIVEEKNPVQELVEKKDEITQSLTEEPSKLPEERTPAEVEQADAADSKEPSEAPPISLKQEKTLQSLMLNAVRRENTYLKNSLTCVQCCQRPAEVTLLPCGHFVLCAVCSEPCLECPVCHARALAEVKTYLG